MAETKMDNASFSAPVPDTRLSGKIYKAWVNFNGETMAIRGSHNITSATDDGANKHLYCADD